MAQEIYHLVCCVDNNYVPHCGVMLTSLLENNKDERIRVHVLDNALTEECREALRGIVERKYGQELAFYPLASDWSASFPATCSYVSLTVYSKLFIASMLPAEVKKVLYLDCDIIVLKSLHELWHCDLSGKAMAAVRDAHRRLEDDCRRLGIDCQTEGYYNAGVMLFNLDYLRSMNFLEKSLDFVSKHASRLPYHDQDVLNGVLHGHILSLPLRYNLHDHLFHRKRYMSREEIRLADREMRPEHRVIIHFSSRRKPWSTRCLHPLRKSYFYYLDMTEWRGRRPRDTFKEWCWRWNRRISGWLHGVNGYRRVR